MRNTSLIVMKPIAPLWARIFILPALLAFLMLGTGVALMGIYSLVTAGPITSLLCIPIGIFIIYISSKGFCLFKYRNIMACIVENKLIYSDGSKGIVQTINIKDLKIVNMPAYQIVHLDNLSTSNRLMSIDYYYMYGMALVNEIKENQGRHE